MKPWAFNQHPCIDDDPIDLTPLIDVVFVVLIMFILIAPLIEIDHIQLSETSSLSHQPSTLPDGHMKIHVHADNSILLNNTPISIEELAAVLSTNHTFNRQQPPHIIHDKRASFGTYQSIKNILESAGFESMDILLQSG